MSSKKDTVTVDLQPMLLPISLIVASLIIGASMFMSARMLSGGSLAIAPSPTAVGNPSAAPSGDTIGNDPAAVPQPSVVTASLDDDAVLGNQDTAQVAIIEFSDYECPFCARFKNDTLGQLKSEYIETGDVVFTYRDLPLPFHPLAQIQAEAAECAGDEGDAKYFEMHDAIFDAGGKLNSDQLKSLAGDLGLNTGNFNDCLDSGKYTEEVEKDASDAGAVGVNGTPGFIIGTLNDDGTVEGEVLSGAQPFSAFEAVISKYL